MSNDDNQDIYSAALESLNDILSINDSNGVYNHIDVSDENYLVAFEIAELEYENIRNDPEDICKIADTTGKELDIIARIKTYIFFDEHDITYPDGAVTRKRFDEDPEIVNSWVRLRENCCITSDHHFIAHEERESYLVIFEDMSYNEAHNLTISEGLTWYPGGE
ncbi:TPA: hypothetical protein ACRRXZ_003739 [Morganella morganii]